MMKPFLLVASAVQASQLFDSGVLKGIENGSNSVGDAASFLNVLLSTIKGMDAVDNKSSVTDLDAPSSESILQEEPALRSARIEESEKDNSGSTPSTPPGWFNMKLYGTSGEFLPDYRPKNSLTPTDLDPNTEVEGLSCEDIKPREWEMFHIINDERAKEHLPPLTFGKHLFVAGRTHAPGQFRMINGDTSAVKCYPNHLSSWLFSHDGKPQDQHYYELCCFGDPMFSEGKASTDCMRYKLTEISQGMIYSPGYELTFYWPHAEWTDKEVDLPPRVLVEEYWMRHHSIELLNQSTWERHPWRSIAVTHAHPYSISNIWLSEMEDPVACEPPPRKYILHKNRSSRSKGRSENTALRESNKDGDSQNAKLLKSDLQDMKSLMKVDVDMLDDSKEIGNINPFGETELLRIKDA